MQYEAKEGQTWDYIAYVTTGDEMSMDAVLSNNDYYYSDVVTLEDGDVVEIPDIVIQEQSIIPSPWG